MEPRAGAQEALTRTRARLAATCALLVGLAFAQEPGLLTADTKFDLALDPGRFLGRALHLWDGASAFGQLQNQAYGYLWPMGPFFWVGHALDVPGWAVQRGWLAVVLVVAFLGAARLARALGVRSDLAMVVAGLAFALSPRMVTTLGPISIEAWPSALAPWVLLPLVVGAERGSPRRAAALSALAIAMVGGVNAAATAAVLPLGAWWILTRTGGPRRRALLVWWPVFTLLGTLWWLLPLFVLGGYSPPFLDYIEAAANTTFPTTLFDSLRGTSNWVPYVDAASRAGNDLLRDVPTIVNSGVLLVLGVAGILAAGRHRLFLAGGVLIGLLMVTAGHEGAVQGWAAPELRTLLDGALAPLRNVHKYDPVIRLPLVLGLGLLVDALLARVCDRPAPADGDDRARRFNARLLAGTAVVAVLGAALPAFVGRIPPAGATVQVPDYWTQAAAWLRDEGSGTSLLVPGSSFGDYVWGSPRDEPFQSLADTSWAVRNAVPLTPAGGIRMLDAVEARLAQGKGSTGLAPYLARAGVTHLVVRNDLQRSSDVPDPVLVHQALADSPGLTRVASFGPTVGGEAHLTDDDGNRLLINNGWQNEYPAVEVYAVAGAAERSEAGVPTAQVSVDPPVVVGGPEDLLSLDDLGLLGDGPTRLAVDLPEDEQPGAPVVLTDGLRDVERNFGRVHDGSSQTLTAGDPLRLAKPVRDYEIGSDRWSTTAETVGGSVSASSSMSDANALGTVQPGLQPFAAVDGEPMTAWVAGYDPDRPGWWQIDLATPERVSSVAVTAGDEDELVRVRSSEGTSAAVPVPAASRRVIEVTGGSTPASWIRVEDASGRPTHSLSLAEVEVPEVSVTRELRLPVLPEAWGAPAAVVLRAVTDDRTGCAELDRAVRCVPDAAVAGEEPQGFDRVFDLSEAASYTADLRVRARPGDALLSELLREQPIGISASTTGNPDPRASALAAIDGDRGTAWTADLADLRPELRLNWLGAKTIRGLRMQVSPDTSARRPETVTLTWPDGEVQVDLDEDGRASFGPITTDQLVVRVDRAEQVSSLGFDSRRQPVPVGVSKLRLVGLPFTPVVLGRRPVERPCGSGPDVVVDGRRTQTRLQASPATLYAGATVDAALCGSRVLQLDAGEHTVRVEANGTTDPVSLTLVQPGGGGTTGSAAEVADAATAGEDNDLSITPPSGRSDRILSLGSNVNTGWVARQDGHDLEPTVVDGWRQAWQLTGDTTVRARFAPDQTYRAGLLGGGLLLLLLPVALVALGRRSVAEGPAPLSAAQAPRLVVWAVAVGMGGLLASWLGALAAVTGVVLAAVVSRRGPDSGLGVVALVLAPAVVAYLVRPWGSDAGWAGALAWPQYLVVVVVSLPLGWATLSAARAARPPRSRSEGTSTSR